MIFLVRLQTDANLLSDCTIRRSDDTQIGEKDRSYGSKDMIEDGTCIFRHLTIVPLVLVMCLSLAMATGKF